MQIYNYHADTLIYTGISTADESPMDKGVFLIPAFAITDSPPAFNSQTELCRYVNGAWTIAEIPPVPVEPLPPEPTAEEVINQLKTVVQVHLDNTARTRGYDSILSLVSYASDDDPVFSAEGTAGKVFRSACWNYLHQVLAQAAGGTRTMPTVTEIISELPAITWPAA